MTDLQDMGLGFTSSGPERDAADLQVCSEVVRELNRYLPAEFDERAAFTGEYSERFSKRQAVGQAIGNGLDIDGARSFAEMSPAAFGEWRAAVTEFEAREAQNLQMLVWTLRTLYRLRDAGFDVDAIAEMVGNVLTDQWKCNPQRIPLRHDADWRAWAERGGRHRGLRFLPMTWRFV